MGKAFGTGAGFGATVAFVIVAFVSVVEAADAAGAGCFLSSWVTGAVIDAAGLATVLPFALTGVAALGVTPSFVARALLVCLEPKAAAEPKCRPRGWALRLMLLIRVLLSW